MGQTQPNQGTVGAYNIVLVANRHLVHTRNFGTQRPIGGVKKRRNLDKIEFSLGARLFKVVHEFQKIDVHRSEGWIPGFAIPAVDLAHTLMKRHVGVLRLIDIEEVLLISGHTVLYRRTPSRLRGVVYSRRFGRFFACYRALHEPYRQNDTA